MNFGKKNKFIGMFMNFRHVQLQKILCKFENIISRIRQLCLLFENWEFVLMLEVLMHDILL